MYKRARSASATNSFCASSGQTPLSVIKASSFVDVCRCLLHVQLLELLFVYVQGFLGKVFLINAKNCKRVGDLLHKLLFDDRAIALFPN